MLKIIKNDDCRSTRHIYMAKNAESRKEIYNRIYEQFKKNTHPKKKEERTRTDDEMRDAIKIMYASWNMSEFFFSRFFHFISVSAEIMNFIPWIEIGCGQVCYTKENRNSILLKNK